MNISEQISSRMQKITRSLNPFKIMKAKERVHSSGKILSSIDRRLLGSLIDWIICGILMAPISFLVIGFFGVETFERIGIEQFTGSINRESGPEPISALFDYYIMTGVLDAKVISYLISIFAIMLYFGASWWYFSCTIGQKLTFSRIVDQSIVTGFSHKAVIMRIFGYLLYSAPFVVCAVFFFIFHTLHWLIIGTALSSILLFVGFLLFFVTRNRQMLHDIISKTIVINKTRITGEVEDDQDISVAQNSIDRNSRVKKS